MIRCDLCGKRIYDIDLEKGAVKAIADQPETDNLCVECNVESENELRTIK